MVPYLRINSNQPFNGIYPIDLKQLDHDFFFYLGEKVANGMSVKNEANLIKDFIIAHPKEKELILSQWDNLKKLLLGECSKKTIEFILPKEYVRWLRFSDYKPIYDNYYSGVETIPVMIDIKDLYEDVINGTMGLFSTTCKKIQEESINSIIIDDCIDIETSTFVQKLKKKYPAVKYFSYSEWKSIQDEEERERQRKIQEQQEEEERLRKMAEKERIAKAEAERLAKEEAERLAKDEEERRKKDEEEQERLQRLKDETLIYNWLVEVYGRYDALGIISEEKRAVLQRAATTALEQLKNSHAGCYVEIPLVYATRYIKNEPTRIKHIEVRLTTEKLEELRVQTRFQQGEGFVSKLKFGLSIYKYQNKFGIVNDEGKIILHHYYDEILEMPSGYIRIKENHKYGILRIDQLNIVYILVPCKYDEIKDYIRYEGRQNYDGIDGYIHYKQKFAWGRICLCWQLLDENGHVCDFESRGILPPDNLQSIIFSRGTQQTAD